MKIQSGFTLIEVLVTGTLASFIGVGVLSIFYMINMQITESTENIKLMQQRLIVADQIRSSARKAYGVKRSKDGTDAVGAFAGTADKPLLTTDLKSNGTNVFFDEKIHNVKFLLKTGLTPDIMGEYVDANRFLQEWNADSLKYKPMLVTGDTIQVDSTQSYFQILPRRRGVISHLVLRRTGADGKVYSLPAIEEVVQCRGSDQ